MTEVDISVIPDISREQSGMAIYIHHSFAPVSVIMLSIGYIADCGSSYGTELSKLLSFVVMSFFRHAFQLLDFLPQILRLRLEKAILFQSSLVELVGPVCTRFGLSFRRSKLLGLCFRRSKNDKLKVHMSARYL